MKRYCFLFIYNLFYCLFLVFALPGYLIKTKKRGGFGTGLLERFGVYRRPKAQEPQGGLYIHAVSVGEVFIACKFIEVWQAKAREEGRSASVVLAVTTCTGHATALAQNLRDVRVLYSPLDFPFLPGRCLNRFCPSLLVLVEAELWPNMGQAAQRRGIAQVMINARLSPKSESHYKAVLPLSRWFYSFLDGMAVQDVEDSRRFEGIGMQGSKIGVTGSIKFDSEGALLPQKRAEFGEVLSLLSQGKPIVLAASTHAGEEVALAEVVAKAGGFPLIVPRHAERREEIARSLRQKGWQVFLRTETAQKGISSQELNLESGRLCYIADTTGELRDWTAHADVVVIGKSFLAHGGQNPVEAILAGVPVISGFYMENFQALVDLLCAEKGLTQCALEDVPEALSRLLGPEGKAQALRAQQALLAHKGATVRTVEYALGVHSSLGGL